MPEKLEVSNRLQQIEEDYQLIIIGGGIYGAALCWEAAHRGIKVLLVEQDDYACGASWNSLKTIHGGLRSLQSLNFMAVIKGIRERTVFLRIAPNYVKQLSCILPTTGALMKSRPVVGAGLLLYNILNHIISLFSKDHLNLPNARLLSRREFISRVPDINPEGITGGALWFDAQATNTERLVLQFIKSAIKKGAVSINHTVALKCGNNGKHDLLIRDQITGFEKTVTGSAIVDCSAAWNFIKHCLPDSGQDNGLTFLKSVNVVIKKRIFDSAVGISGRIRKGGNSRLYFLSPWRDSTMIGTWYTSVEHYSMNSFSNNEAAGIIDDVNSALGNKLLDIQDICNVHIGYLPANKVHNNDSVTLDQSLISRYQLKDWSGQPGMQGIYSLRGTKYTLARYDAEQVIDKLASKMKWDVSVSQSDRLPLYERPVKADYLHELPDEIENCLLVNYGADIDVVLSYISQDLQAAEIIPGTQYHIMAEIYYAVFNEQALTLCDLLKRRLDTGDQAPPEQVTAEYCAEVMQRLLSWSDQTAQAQVLELYKSYPEYLIRDKGFELE